MRENGNVLCGECANLEHGACAAAELALYRAGLPEVPLAWSPDTSARNCRHFQPNPSHRSRLAELRSVA